MGHQIYYFLPKWILPWFIRIMSQLSGRHYVSNDLVEGDEAFVNLRKHCCSKRQQIFNYGLCKSLFKIGIYNNITKTIL